MSVGGCGNWWMGWLVHGGTRAKVLCPRPTHAALETWGGDPGSEPALPGVGATLETTVPSLQAPPHTPWTLGALPSASWAAVHSTGNASVDHWPSLQGDPGKDGVGSQDSRDLLDPQDLSSTCRSRT